MARIFDLVRPKTAFGPETIAVLSAALDEAWERPPRVGVHPARLCACYARGHRAAHHRHSATGRGRSKGACR
jgi:hypothetical protein